MKKKIAAIVSSCIGLTITILGSIGWKTKWFEQNLTYEVLSYFAITLGPVLIVAAFIAGFIEWMRHKQRTAGNRIAAPTVIQINSIPAATDTTQKTSAALADFSTMNNFSAIAPLAVSSLPATSKGSRQFLATPIATALPNSPQKKPTIRACSPTSLTGALPSPRRASPAPLASLAVPLDSANSLLQSKQLIFAPPPAQPVEAWLTPDKRPAQTVYRHPSEVEPPPFSL